MGGGFTGLQHTEETKEVIRKKLQQKYIDNPELRKENSERVREAMKGLNISERMGKSEKWRQYVKYLRENSIRKGPEYHDEETKSKISESLKKYYESIDEQTRINNRTKHEKAMTEKLGRAVIQLTKEDEAIATYPSIAEAGRQSGVRRTNISNTLKGISQTAGGYKWKYA